MHGLNGLQSGGSPSFGELASHFSVRPPHRAIVRDLWLGQGHVLHSQKADSPQVDIHSKLQTPFLVRTPLLN